MFSNTHDVGLLSGRNYAETGVCSFGAFMSTSVALDKFFQTFLPARQFVTHGHVTVKGKRCNIGSARLKAGDVVQVREKSRNLALVLEALGSGERDIPDYVEVDPKAMTAAFKRIPVLSDVPYPVKMEPAQVVEFYSS